jgi:membrane dipeptidase
MTIVDAHLDLAYNVGRGRDVTKPAREQPIAENEIATVGFPDLRAGGVSLVFATIFCQPQTQKHAGYTSPAEAHEQALVQLKQYDAWFAAGELKRRSNKDPNPLPAYRERGPEAVLLLEGAEAIRTPADVQMFYDRGVRLVGLSWQRTRYAGGTATPGPLTPAGREIVREFDRLGIVHDASHLAERSFWDLFNFTDKLIVASHSNCRSIVKSDPNERHMTDAMIRAIAERGGVIGINFFDRFLMPFDEYGKRRCNLDDVVAHVKHICNLTGSDEYVGIGTDMDGGLGREQIPVEIETASDMPRVAEKLAAAGFSEAAVGKVMGGNWLRVVQSAFS